MVRVVRDTYYQKVSSVVSCEPFFPFLPHLLLKYKDPIILRYDNLETKGLLHPG